MRFCPECDKSWPDATDNCPDDGTATLDEAAYKARVAADASDLVSAGRADNRFEADMLEALLSDEGIHVHVANHERSETTADFDPVDYFELMVHEQDLARAQELIEQRRGLLEKEREEAARAAEEEERAGEEK